MNPCHDLFELLLCRSKYTKRIREALFFFCVGASSALMR